MVGGPVEYARPRRPSAAGSADAAAQPFGLDWITINKHLHDHVKKAKMDCALNSDKDIARSTPTRSGWKACLLLQVRPCMCVCTCLRPLEMCACS